MCLAKSSASAGGCAAIATAPRARSGREPEIWLGWCGSTVAISGSMDWIEGRSIVRPPGHVLTQTCIYMCVCVYTSQAGRMQAALTGRGRHQGAPLQGGGEGRGHPQQGERDRETHGFTWTSLLAVPSSLVGPGTRARSSGEWPCCSCTCMHGGVQWGREGVDQISRLKPGTIERRPPAADSVALQSTALVSNTRTRWYARLEGKPRSFRTAHTFVITLEPFELLERGAHISTVTAAVWLAKGRPSKKESEKGRKNQHKEEAPDPNALFPSVAVG